MVFVLLAVVIVAAGVVGLRLQKKLRPEFRNARTGPTISDLIMRNTPVVIDMNGEGGAMVMEGGGAPAARPAPRSARSEGNDGGGAGFRAPVSQPAE